MQEFVDELNDCFIYIDCSTLVNAHKIMGLVNDRIIITGVKNTFEMSARRLKEVKGFLKEKGL